MTDAGVFGDISPTTVEQLVRGKVAKAKGCVLWSFVTRREKLLKNFNN